MAPGLFLYHGRAHVVRLISILNTCIMYLSLVCVVSLIAAGSIAKPCSKRAKAQAGFPAPLQYTNTSTPSVSVIANPSAGGAPSSGGSCPAGFLNVVLNTGATKQPGWPETIWSTLTKSGIHEWSKSIIVLLSTAVGVLTIPSPQSASPLARSTQSLPIIRTPAPPR